MECGFEVNLTEAAYGNAYEPCRKPKGHAGWHSPEGRKLERLDADRLARAMMDVLPEAAIEALPFGYGWAEKIAAEYARLSSSEPPD